MPPERVHLRGLTKRFRRVVAVDGIDLDVAPGEFFSLLGWSTCPPRPCARWRLTPASPPRSPSPWVAERDHARRHDAAVRTRAGHAARRQGR
jgi:hypothetical protein